MTDIVERLRGSPHIRCILPGCFEGHQVCPHDEEEIYDAWADAMHKAADEIEMLRRVKNDAAEWVKERTKRLRADNERLRAALRVLADADTYMLHLAEWHDTGHMAAGVRSIASAALEGKE